MLHEEYRKLAIITGASSGIGFELARIFAKNNYDLVLVSHSDNLSDKAKILRQYEVEVTEVEANLAIAWGVEELYEKINHLARPIDVAVINAGVGIGGEFVKTTWEEELNMINLNVVNLVYLAKLVLKDMAKFNEGKILFSSSLESGIPGPYNAVYTATKAFIQSFAEAVRYEMDDTDKNITITTLRPGEDAQQGFAALMSGKDQFMSAAPGEAAQAKNVKPKDLDQ